LALLQLKPRHSLLVLIAAFGIGMFGVPEGPAQTANPNSTEKNFTPGMDISLGAYSQITATTVGDFGASVFQKTQGTSPSAGVLGTFHQSFKPWLGYNVNVGYTRFAESYSYGAAFIPSQSSTFKPFASFLKARSKPIYTSSRLLLWSQGLGIGDSAPSDNSAGAASSLFRRKATRQRASRHAPRWSSALE
jgi:hypothetical protein